MDIGRFWLLFFVFVSVKYEVQTEDIETASVETKNVKNKRGRYRSTLRKINNRTLQRDHRLVLFEDHTKPHQKQRQGFLGDRPRDRLKHTIEDSIYKRSTNTTKDLIRSISEYDSAQRHSEESGFGRYDANESNVAAAESRERKRTKVNKIWQSKLAKPQRLRNVMLSDTDESAVIVSESKAGNHTPTLSDKIGSIRNSHRGVQTYEAVGERAPDTHVAGVLCDFETSPWSNGTSGDSCTWQWNRTVTPLGNGFRVLSPADLAALNETSDYKLKGPAFDADGSSKGHFLYLPVDSTMDTMVIKSPLFFGVWEFCKFEAMLHQYEMKNASLRVVAEIPHSNLSWILQEVAGNNVQEWQPLKFLVGKVQQDVQFIMELVPPTTVLTTRALPYVAIDNIRMTECFPEPPVFGGECGPGQFKCSILKQESCIKLQQVCDLVRDCDSGLDEQQNCDKMPFGSYCNFEQGFCGFADIEGNILRWTRHNGPTPTDKTGPNHDHTCGAAAAPAVPLSPAGRNAASAKCVGWYLFVNMNVTGPGNKKPDFASTAVMRSAVFNPPPRVHGNITSKYYNCCMIRFYYQQNGRNYGSMSVVVVQITATHNISTSLWFSSKDKGEHWYRAAIFLPNITTRYYIEIRTRMGMRIYSDSAIDDFSMAPECFGLNMEPAELGDYNYYDPVNENAQITAHKAFKDKPVYRFTPCGATGRFGPNQTMCDESYKWGVSVVTQPPYRGVQMWQVPAEGYYTVVAMGARGGLGSAYTGLTQGARVRGLFQLRKGEMIYLLVGQQGTNACKKALSTQYDSSCQKNATNTSRLYTSKTQEVKNTYIRDGGGGGGGATFVFVIDDDGGGAVPLVVAGGAGGLSVGAFVDDGSQQGRGPGVGPPQSGYMYGEPGHTSGAGGGWRPRPGPHTPGFELVRGAALSEGAAGGVACSGGAHGGFGGGGGGCIKGGGGGGYIGGDTRAGEHGGGGYSFMSERAAPAFTEFGLSYQTHGEVIIVPAIHECGCDFRCVALDEHRSQVRCFCPAAWQNDEQDPTKCIMQPDWTRVQWTLIVVLSVVVLMCTVGLLGACLYLYNTYQRKKEEEVRRRRLLEQEVALRRLRHAPDGSELALSNFNPHYGSDAILPQGIDVRGLPQVTRESLKLVKALGQGAFGEVYQGLYQHRAVDAQDMPVAVKTLPELSTGQAETEFLMEAAIMAKFNHPNVVHLIGVCFDRHPRFIVLELLAGGDLKNFLRENRPKPERCSSLTMKDLLLCALDVAKGCRYLESKRFIHRDIAARNCLLTCRGPGRAAKIADFGMARDIYRADYYKKGGKALLPIKWMPPEAFLDGVFTTKTDCWSFGVLLWEVFSMGVMPYTGCTNREVMDLVVEGGRLQKPFPGCADEIYKLMNDSWHPDPDKRPSFLQIHDTLQLLLQDPEILATPLPVMRAVGGATTDDAARLNGAAASS